jgi:dimeric dUTPase (all-alpha-NTP-PPase superfamily)
MDKALQMLQLQQQLNDATNGEEWEKGVTKNGKAINWKRCIYMECAEMIDSFAWKHWKSIARKPDWENLKIEVVDVWHFVMSEALRDASINFRGTIDDLALNISQMPSYRALQHGEFHLDPVMKNFFELTKMSGLNLALLYRLYVGKNILNQFRQDHGYKEGTYIKEWGSVEDNVAMKRIWEENGEISPEELYAELEKRYTRVS